MWHNDTFMSLRMLLVGNETTSSFLFADRSLYDLLWDASGWMIYLQVVAWQITVAGWLAWKYHVQGLRALVYRRIMSAFREVGIRLSPVVAFGLIQRIDMYMTWILCLQCHFFLWRHSLRNRFQTLVNLRLDTRDTLIQLCPLSWLVSRLIWELVRPRYPWIDDFRLLLSFLTFLLIGVACWTILEWESSESRRRERLERIQSDASQRRLLLDDSRSHRVTLSRRGQSDLRSMRLLLPSTSTTTDADAIFSIMGVADMIRLYLAEYSWYVQIVRRRELMVESKTTAPGYSRQERHDIMNVLFSAEDVAEEKRRWSPSDDTVGFVQSLRFSSSMPSSPPPRLVMPFDRAPTSCNGNYGLTLRIPGASWNEKFPTQASDLRAARAILSESWVFHIYSKCKEEGPSHWRIHSTAFAFVGPRQCDPEPLYAGTRTLTEVPRILLDVFPTHDAARLRNWRVPAEAMCTRPFSFGTTDLSSHKNATDPEGEDDEKEDLLENEHIRRDEDSGDDGKLEDADLKGSQPRAPPSMIRIQLTIPFLPMASTFLDRGLHPFRMT